MNKGFGNFINVQTFIILSSSWQRHYVFIEKNKASSVGALPTPTYFYPFLNGSLPEATKKYKNSLFLKV